MLEGTGCTECDASPAIYIESPTDGPIYPTQSPYPRPGLTYSPDLEDTIPVIRARTFVGTCLSDMTVGIVWFAAERQDSSWFAKVRVLDVVSDTLRTRNLSSPLPNVRDLSRYVSSGSCRELEAGQ